MRSKAETERTVSAPIGLLEEPLGTSSIVLDDAPEILQVIHEIPHASPLLEGLYHCRYRELMGALVATVDVMLGDRCLAEHARYYYREVRVPLREHPAWRAYFMRANSVPLDEEGRVLSDYRPKLDTMLRQLDQRGYVEAQDAELSYETWI